MPRGRDPLRASVSWFYLNRALFTSLHFPRLGLSGAFLKTQFDSFLDSNPDVQAVILASDREMLEFQSCEANE